MISYSCERDGVRQTCLAVREGRRSGVRFDRSEGKGKGSHGRLYLGDKATFVKRSEIGRGLLAAMLKELGIRKEEF